MIVREWIYKCLFSPVSSFIISNFNKNKVANKLRKQTTSTSSTSSSNPLENLNKDSSTQSKSTVANLSNLNSSTMHFSKTFATLLLSTALSTLVASSPIASTTLVERSADPTPEDDVNITDSKLVRRFQNLDDDVDADPEVWDKLEAFCGGKSKRSLVARAPAGGPWNEVPMGDSQKMDGIPIGLWTQKLRSCMGMGVTATNGQGQQVRVLGHFTTDRSSKESQWQKFSGLVNEDWEDRKGFMSIPDTENNVPSMVNDEDSLKAINEIIDELKKRLDSLVDGDPATVTRPMGDGTGPDANTMSIDGSNAVKVNGGTLAPN